MTAYTPTFPTVRSPKRTTVIAAGLAACAVAGIALFSATTDTQTTAAPEVAVTQSTATNSADLKFFNQGIQPAQVGAAAPGAGHPGGVDQQSVIEFAQANNLSGLSPASAAPISLPSVETLATDASVVSVASRSDFASDADWINANGWGGEAISGVAGNEQLVLPRSIFASDAEWINANGWANEITTSAATDQTETVQPDRGGPR